MIKKTNKIIYFYSFQLKIYKYILYLFHTEKHKIINLLYKKIIRNEYNLNYPIEKLNKRN